MYGIDPGGYDYLNPALIDRLEMSGAVTRSSSARPALH
jgi:hypothetical protein